MQERCLVWPPSGAGLKLLRGEGVQGQGGRQAGVGQPRIPGRGGPAQLDRQGDPRCCPGRQSLQRDATGASSMSRDKRLDL